jgi:hypothetical protein
MRATKAPAASLNWRQEWRSHIVISEAGFRSRNPLSLFPKFRFRTPPPLHPIYVDESVVGSLNCHGYRNRGLVSGTDLAGAFRLKRRDRCPVRILWVYHARRLLL